jgi:hypothetical protein
LNDKSGPGAVIDQEQLSGSIAALLQEEYMRKIELNKSQGEMCKAFCATRKSDTNHEVIQTVDVTGNETIRYWPN